MDCFRIAMFRCDFGFCFDWNRLAKSSFVRNDNIVTICKML